MLKTFSFSFLGYLLLVYGFVKEKSFRIGEVKLIICLCIFLFATAVLFLQNLLLKQGLVILQKLYCLEYFYILFLNETEKNNIDILIAIVAITTLCLSAVLCLEVVVQANPLMKLAEHLVDNFIYLSPKYYAFSGDYYRPYATYFHPSEAGTFVAMGLPFVYYFVRQKHPCIKYAALFFGRSWSSC